MPRPDQGPPIEISEDLLETLRSIPVVNPLPDRLASVRELLYNQNDKEDKGESE